MVDVHCHLLPGIDDGPREWEVSLAMAEAAVQDGITHVVATPHSSSAHVFDYARVRRLRDELQQKVGDRLQLATGCDFHMNPENVAAVKKDAPPFCINQKNYLLVEFNEFSIPASMDYTLHDLQLAGLRPIITHPERNRILRSQPERFTKWVRLGCYVQITGGALTGNFGDSARLHAIRWVGEGLVHFVASDAHDMRKRPLVMTPAYNVLKSEFGEEKATALTTDNPLAALEGRPLPHVPELVDGKVPARRKRFLFF